MIAEGLLVRWRWDRGIARDLWGFALLDDNTGDPLLVEMSSDNLFENSILQRFNNLRVAIEGRMIGGRLVGTSVTRLI